MSESIDSLLTESALDGDPALRRLLDEIERESTAVRPMPSAELAALMDTGSLAAGSPATRRRRRALGRGGIIAGVAIIGAVGLGAASAAASPEVRSAIGAGVAAVAHFFEPAAPSPRSGGGGRPGSTPAPAATLTAATPSTSESPTDDPTDRADPGSSGAHGSTGAKNGPGNGNGNGNGNQSGHGRGTGNQSGHGNGTGKGNGGPAPAP